MDNLHKELVQDERYVEAFKDVTVYGVAGTNGAGKDVLLETLARAGFFAFNAGDALRHIAMASMGTTQRGGNESPMGRIANTIRSTYPGGMVELGLLNYWAQVLCLPAELQPRGLVIGSIRGVGEVKRLHAFGGKLIVVDADPHVRFARLKSRGRHYEADLTFEQFQAEEKAEMGHGETDHTRFGMAQVIEMADLTLMNNGDDLKAFKQDIKKRLALL